jgi:Zn-dependent protease with chaperone function
LVSDQNRAVPGEWHAARSNISINAKATISGNILLIHDTLETKVLTQADIQTVNISTRVGSIPRELTFPDGSLFETPDNDSIDALLAGHRKKGAGFVHWLEQFKPRLIGITAAAVFLTYATYKLALPALVEVAVAVTPAAVPQLMSASTLQALDQTTFAPTELSQEQQQAIREDFARIAAHAEGASEDYKLNFRKGGFIGPNAFALPDGTLVVTDELVELAGNDLQMITGVLAHEIGHIEHEHSLRQLYRAAGIAGLVMLVAGDVGSAMEDILTQGGGLLALSHSRDAEAEADRRSVELMRAAGLDATAIERFFAMMEEKFGDSSKTSMLATHPGTPERRKAILDYDRELQEKPAP